MRLPTRKRSRAAMSADEAETDAHAEAPLAAAGVSDMVPLDLIAELVANGSLAPHLAAFSAPTEVSGWRARRAINLELELGSVLAVIEPSSAPTTLDTSNTKSLPLLLRAFRRPVTEERKTTLSALHGEQPLDAWAPTPVMHAARALMACGLNFHGPRILHRQSKSVPAVVKGRRYVVTRRTDTEPGTGSEQLCGVVLTVGQKDAGRDHAQLEGAVGSAAHIPQRSLRHRSPGVGNGGRSNHTG